MIYRLTVARLPARAGGLLFWKDYSPYIYILKGSVQFLGSTTGFLNRPFTKEKRDKQKSLSRYEVLSFFQISIDILPFFCYTRVVRQIWSSPLQNYSTAAPAQLNDNPSHQERLHRHHG
jgi:hypothetical protein